VSNKLREKFLLQANEVLSGKWEPKLLVTVVQLPSGGQEVATNSSNIEEKINYILENYDDDFRFKKSPQVQVIGYILV